jgi:xanthine dehydrogenase YagT iron-sulfur-binding subunit
MTGSEHMPANGRPDVDDDDLSSGGLVISRRSALQGGSAIVAASIFADRSAPAEAATALQPAPLPVAPAHAVTVRTTVNGTPIDVDGRRVASCLTLAAKVEGREVHTIEGLSEGGTLHPMQQAFIDHDALQCGYCTPGQIMAAVACVNEGNATSKERIREYMSGNICRCGAYVGIVAAIEDAAAKMRRG